MIKAQLTEVSVPFVVTDTEAKMNTFGMEMEKLCESLHIYCVDHLLQLVAMIAYEYKFVGDSNAEDETPLLKKVRDLVGLFNK